MAGIEEDPRAQWLGAKAAKGLSSSYELYQDLLENSLAARNLLSDFLDRGSDKAGGSGTLLIYLEVTEEEVAQPASKKAPVKPEPELVPESALTEPEATNDLEADENGVSPAEDGEEGPKEASEEGDKMEADEKADTQEDPPLTEEEEAEAKEGEPRGEEEAADSEQAEEENKLLAPAEEVKPEEVIRVTEPRVRMGLSLGQLPASAAVSRSGERPLAGRPRPQQPRAGAHAGIPAAAAWARQAGRPALRDCPGGTQRDAQLPPEIHQPGATLTTQQLQVGWMAYFFVIGLLAVTIGQSEILIGRILWATSAPQPMQACKII
eukprot:scaffold117564_cov45-Prasinocladus_malaysianus.AAC.1